MTRPFKIESKDITRLNDIQLTLLLSELLHAEAYKFGIAQRAAEVALNIRVGDGGEDGRISWCNGPESTDYIPNRLTMFQNKATKKTPAGYATEIMTEATKKCPSVVKEKVDEVLAQGGSYIFFTTQELNKKQKDERIAAIRKKLCEQGKLYADTSEICIYDASDIAGWSNNFISVVVSVQHWAGLPMERGLKTFYLWSEHEDLLRFPFVAVKSRTHIVETLGKLIAEPKSCFRIVGLSGLGKTRTAFQIFSENETIKNLVVYVDANHARTIDSLVADWVSHGLEAILVVDNCEYRLHEHLVQEVRRESSKISLLSLDYNFEIVKQSTCCFTLSPMTDEELLQLLVPIYKEKLPDLDRIVKFAQGFPQMAVLLAEARLAEEPRIGELTEDELANKLLWRRSENENPERLKILQACSLFDIFGVEKEVENQLQYIADLVNIDLDTVYKCVQAYSARGLIDRRGRFGQVVPKPLAIRLAGQWWTNSREQKQLDLVNGIPEGMIDGFCRQVEKMDFHPNVKQLTEKLCGVQSPFGQAEVILSVRGSRLFRSLVNVNPEATASALFKVLEKKNHQQLSAIVGDARRNLVWSLEMLCFHTAIFSEAAWCLLLLASAENENFSNNATGMFAQLFRINLSGTASEPTVRFALLNQALDLNQCNVDRVVLEALEQAISTYGGTRTVGAEYQGTKAPLEEWRPKIWQEIYDYWQEAFNLLLRLFERGDAQKEKVLSVIGHSIRGYVHRGRINMLDGVIKDIVSLNGRYWPAALNSIKDTFEYDSNGLKEEAKDALNSWLELLSPDNADLSEKLKIIVVDPPLEHHMGPDGHYIDIASENAKKFGVEVANDVNALIPYLDLLLNGDQNQADSFGYQLALNVGDFDHLLEQSLTRLLAANSANPSFILGIYRGIFERSSEVWQKYVDRILADGRYIFLYPDLIRTGNIQKQHLDIFLQLICSGTLSPNSANILSYGSVTSGISPDTIAEFCLSLAEMSEDARWPALNIIYMYCFGKQENIDTLRNPLKQLVSIVPLHEERKGTAIDMHEWHDLAQKLLKVRDEEFAIVLTNQLISACKNGLNHSDIWHYTKPLLLDLMREYGNVLWPIFASAIVEAEGMTRYWLQQLLDRENNFENQQPSVLTVLPVDIVILWCKEYPGFAPSFVANCVNILEPSDGQQKPSDLFVALLEHFGDDERVVRALSANMWTRGWSGSLVPYLESDKAAFEMLLIHENSNVKQWGKKTIDYICKQIAVESVRDEEDDFGLF